MVMASGRPKDHQKKCARSQYAGVRDVSTVCGILLDVPCLVPGCPGHCNESVGDRCAYCAANARQKVPCLCDVVPSLFSTLGDFEPDLDEA
jgi:hypothetical protein